MNKLWQLTQGKIDLMIQVIQQEREELSDYDLTILRQQEIKNVELLADKLQLNEITIEEFQVGLFIATKRMFVASLLVFGFNYSDFYAEEIKKQINWIDRFGLDIKNGRINGTLQHRASLYIWSGAYFFEELRKKQSQKAGYTHVRRRCKDCPDCNTDWVSINSKTHIVDGILGRGYECEYEFKKVDPSKVA